MGRIRFSFAGAWIAFLALLVLVLPMAGLGTYSVVHASLSVVPSKVMVGLYVMNVEKCDLRSGSYDVDFYLWFSWSGNQTINYELMNGRASSIDVIEKSDGYLELRVRGTFLKCPNFKNYPFGRHELTIEIEDKSLSLDRLVFTPDEEESGVDLEINLVGWNVEGWAMKSVEHKYPGDVSFSRLVFSVIIGVSILSSILKSVVPLAIIASIAMLLLLVSPSYYGQRITAGVAVLIAAVANHLALISQLPPIGYLTLADKIMIIVYGMIFCSLVISVWAMRLVDGKRTEAALKLNRNAGIMIPVVAGTILCVLILLA